MYSVKEFAEKYRDKEVKLSVKTISHMGTNWDRWRGIVKGSAWDTITTTTKISCSHGYPVGGIVSWNVIDLVVIEEIETTNFTIPENKTICPQCKSFECKGMARLDCISRGNK